MTNWKTDLHILILHNINWISPKYNTTARCRMHQDHSVYSIEAFSRAIFSLNLHLLHSLWTYHILDCQFAPVTVFFSSVINTGNCFKHGHRIASKCSLLYFPRQAHNCCWIQQTQYHRITSIVNLFFLIIPLKVHLKQYMIILLLFFVIIKP